MLQHFLLSAARTVSLKQILRMKEAEVWAMFCSIRWPETEGAPVCPYCGCPTCWVCPRPNRAPRFRCSACRRDFSPTSGTLFAFHKLEIRDYLAAVVIFCDEVKGKAALALSRDLEVQYKTAFVLAHKIRVALQLLHDRPKARRSTTVRTAGPQAASGCPDAARPRPSHEPRPAP
jgi:transposase-like protein